jgi:rare lipoprotein A (peptidoglycan hydrolase)
MPDAPVDRGVRLPSARAVALALTSIVLAAALVGPPNASAGSVKEDLDKARAARSAAEQAVRNAERKLDGLLARFQAARLDLSSTAADLVEAYQSQRTLTDRLDQAQAELDERAAEAYILGPGAAIDVYLGARTLADFSSVSMYVQSAFGTEGRVVDDVVRAKADLAALTASLQARQGDLAASVETLAALSDEATAEMDDALAQASAAKVEVDRLEEEQRRLEEAAAEVARALDGLIDSSRGTDQSALMALLGPTGGKTCDTPDGLVDTGEQLEGMSSWYGWEFAGQPTASGAIFDPRLFTVANKELPLGAFLRFRYDGSCAIALVNDRGPYGVEGRIFDVAEAVAQYLGYKSAGVAYVTADVLVPAP